ncbi:MAG: UxaA family hydrolase [Ilumatobacter sp.]|uniref:UxaA family hydrolase n=1 Tax=Ilumatobacter sp. TaxID=1967498 RepID=UPI0026273A84|nr:UxaA family hydrolase [Ilumatobacter sp.]MDJ0767715.1 UxaA family hydrolase [Ilumatobacter sp.]
MKPDIVIHDPTDSVGVAVVEGIEADQELAVWIMDTNESASVVSKEPIPLGHKIAMVNLTDGDTLVKYGHDIGRMIASCPIGGHVHVHNAKTKRW